MKVREGNDFNVTWLIMQDELTPLNTEGIYDEMLILVFGEIEKEITSGITRTDNSIRLEITPCAGTLSRSISYRMEIQTA